MSKAAKQEPSASNRVFAIGDIHGCPDELSAVLSSAEPGPEDTVIFMGDYVDRGPAARDVIDILIDIKRTGRTNAVFLKGNHEDMMLSFLGMEGHYGESFLMNGGLATLESYGIGPEDLFSARELIPADHLEFLSELRIKFIKDSHLFVHAGIQPLRSLEEQDPEDLMWIRQDFILNRHELGLTVVFGHTPVRDVLLDLPYKIGIDTGLVYGGKLTCVELTEGVCHQVVRGSGKVKRHALAR